MTLKIIFMGSPEFSIPTLQSIINAGHEVVAVYSQPPKARTRRGSSVVPTPVHEFAASLNIPVFTPDRINEVEIKRFTEFNADIAVVVAYGLLLPKGILEGTKYGCFNGHTSILPRWRGAAPIQRAIMAGDNKTGVTIFKMDEGLDTGPIVALNSPLVDITDNMTSGELHDILSLKISDDIISTIEKIEQNTISFIDNNFSASYAKKIKKEEAKLDFAKSALELHNTVRGLSPTPGCWFETTINGKLERIKCFDSTVQNLNGNPGEIISLNPFIIACGNNAIKFAKLQRAGGKILSSEEFLRGSKLMLGKI